MEIIASSFRMFALAVGLAFSTYTHACSNLLYEVRRGDQFGYLIGSSHANSSKMCSLTSRSRQVLQSASNFYFETSKTTEGNAAANTAFVASLSLPPPQKLESVAGPERIENISAWLIDRGLGKKLIEKWSTARPLLVALYLTTIDGLSKAAPNPGGKQLSSASLDAELVALAKAGGARVGGLETGGGLDLLLPYSPDEDLRTLDSMYRLITCDACKQKMKTSAELSVNLLNIGKIDEAIQATQAAYDDLGLQSMYKLLVSARNPRFADRITSTIEHDEKPAFAIGAMHLGGNDGILAILRKRGFSVALIEN